jgi:hypothetical protein
MNLRLIRFLAGMAIAITIYIAAVEAYNRYLAQPRNRCSASNRRFASATIEPRGRKVVVSGGVPSADIPADQLSYNFILLTALFASNRSALRDRNMRAFAISLLIVLLVHPSASFSPSKPPTRPASRSGANSTTATLPPTPGVLAELFYRVVGMFGIVFACWFVAPTRE